jgi:hypothetical protein
VDVAKVDWDVAYVAMAIHVCCKRLFQMFQLLQTNVARLGIAYVFIVILQMFYLGVAYVSHFMLQVFHPNVAYVLNTCFRLMLQVFQMFRTHVTNVSSSCCKSRFDVTHVAVDPICSNRLLKLLGLPACAWV